MAIKEFKMPHLGESVTEASISQWFVKVGDKVNRFDPIAEAVSDKVTTEIPSDFTGTINEILIDTDVDVEIGTPILKIEVEGEEGELEESKETDENNSEEIVDSSNDKPKTNQGKTSKVSQPQTDSSGKRFSPAVRRIADERGIDLSLVEGSGRHGRITRKDVEFLDLDTLKATDSLETSDSSSVQSEEPALQAVQETVENVSTESKVQEPKSSTQQTRNDNTNVVKADPIRKKIAEKMSQSKNEIPHAWMMIEVDVSNIVKLRNKVKEQFLETEGIKLSYFPFFVKAVTQAIKKHPIINTSWDDGNIIYHKDINTSIAVGTDDALFVPVIRNADHYSISGIAKEIDRLASGVQDNTLTPNDMQGGTITVNNTGVFGSVQSMGIINHPQAAILQVESINQKVVVSDDGGMKFAHMVNLCLSMDHRILDGVAAGRFLNQVKENLQNFDKESDIY